MRRAVKYETSQKYKVSEILSCPQKSLRVLAQNGQALSSILCN